MAEKILLETEAASIGAGKGAIDKKCCTKSRAEALGCKVDGNYQPNQLIPEGSVSRAFVSKVRVFVTSSEPLDLIYFIKIYDGGNTYLDSSNTGYIKGDGSEELVGIDFIYDTNAIGKSLSVSITFKEVPSASMLHGSYKWKLNGNRVSTNTITLHQGDEFDIIFTPTGL